MLLLSYSRTLFGLLFLLALLAVGGWNAYLNGPQVLDAITSRPEPLTLRNAGEGFKQARTLVRWGYLGRFNARATRASLMTMLGRREMNNFSVIKGPDSRLYRGGMYDIDTTNAALLAECIAGLSEIAANGNTNLMYLATPDAVIKGAVRPPDYMPVLDYNIATDSLLYTLREKNVPSLDSRYSYQFRGFPLDEVTPRTAALLTGKAAFALFTYLVDALESAFYEPLDPGSFYRDIANYRVETKPDFFMGDLGRETGPAFSGLDDFTTILPAFDTRFSLEGRTIFNTDIALEGTAEETLFRPDNLIGDHNLFTFYPESFYSHANLSWSVVRNQNNVNGPRVFFVHDFYTAQLVSLLAPLCNELHTLTFHENQSMSAEEYISDKTFDYIILSFFPANILRPESQTLILEDGAPVRE